MNVQTKTRIKDFNANPTQTYTYIKWQREKNRQPAANSNKKGLKRQYREAAGAD